MAKTVVGMYEDFGTTQKVVDDLQNNGFDRGDIDVFGGNRGKGGDLLIDSLTSAGVPESDARLYADGVNRGDSLVMVATDDAHADRAATIMDRYDPLDLGALRGASWQGQEGRFEGERFADTTTGTTQPFRSETSGRQDLTDEGETHLPIVEEEMRVGKRDVERGGIRVHSYVTEHPFEETHTVRDESVNVERRPVDRELEGADMSTAFQDQTFEVTETDEELVTDKRPHVVEDVVVSKSVEERPETVRDTLRRTDVETENLGSRTTRGTRDFSTFDSEFRNHYNMAYGTSGRNFDYYQPGYRYGYDLAGMDRYRGRKWSEIEPDARREWERTRSGSKWEDFKDSIRYGWERVTGQAQDTGPQGGTFTRPSTDTGYGTGTQESLYGDQENNP